MNKVDKWCSYQYAAAACLTCQFICVDSHITSIFICSRRKDTKSFGILFTFERKSAKSRMQHAFYDC